MYPRRTVRSAPCFARLIVAGALLFSWAAIAAAAVHTVALHGDNPFDTGEIATFASFTTPSLNNRGQIAFAAQLTGDDVVTGNDTGYWIAGGGSPSSVIREGAAAPGMPNGAVFGNVPSLFTGQVSLNDAGEIAVGHAVTLPDSSTSSGLWIGNRQSLSLLAAQGSAAPGAQDNASFLGLSGTRATLNRHGDVAFNASLNGQFYTTFNSVNVHDGLWILNRGGPVAEAVAATNVSELDEDAQFYGFRAFTYPSLNRHGEAAFSATHRLTPGLAATGFSLWVMGPSARELRGVNGQPWPDLGENATLDFGSAPGINSAGTVAVNGYFDDADGSRPYGTAIIVSTTTDLSLQAYSGGPVPGIPGQEFRETYYEASIGSGGHIAFYGYVWDGADTNSSLSGVWAGRPDELQLVALEDESAPNANATFGSFFRNTPSVNRFGQVAFPAGLSDSQSGASSTSLWATDLDGNLTMIARTGTTLEVANGDIRTISSLVMLTNHGDDDGRPRGMNDLGQIAFRAIFADGSSGIFLSDAVAHLPGDYNGDHIVDTADYLVWRKALATQDLIADGDRDGIVGEGDRAIWNEFFGMSLTLDSSDGGTAAPEPEAAVLVATCFTVFIFRRCPK